MGRGKAAVSITATLSLLACTGLIAVGLVHSRDRLEAVDAGFRSAPTDHGYFSAVHFRGPALGFMAFVRDTIPPGAAYLVIQTPEEFGVHDIVPTPSTPNGTCGIGPAGIYRPYIFLTFSLLPRVSTCDPKAEWRIYFHYSAPKAAPGQKLFVYAPGYSVVHMQPRP